MRQATAAADGCGTMDGHAAEADGVGVGSVPAEWTGTTPQVKPHMGRAQRKNPKERGSGRPEPERGRDARRGASGRVSEGHAAPRSAVAESGAGVDPGSGAWRRAAPAALIRLAAAWVLVGGLAKAFSGTPSELPVPILEWDLDPFVVIPVAIVVELLVAVTALVRPRLGAWPLAGLLVAFSGLLVLHIRAGGESCGCFGGAFPIPAPVMLGVDASLAVITGAAMVALVRRRAVEASGADPAPRRGHPLAGPVVGLALGLGCAWFADARLRPLRPTSAGGVGAVAGAQSAEAARRIAESLGGVQTPVTVPIIPLDEVGRAPRPWSLPTQFPSEVILRPITWINKPLASTELGRWTDTSLFPPDALIVLYYDSCSHCAEHLRDLAAKQQADAAALPPIVLAQLPTPVGPGIRRFVDVVPEGMHVHLPKEITRWVMTPPWDVWTEGRIVRRAERVRSAK